MKTLSLPHIVILILLALSCATTDKTPVASLDSLETIYKIENPNTSKLDVYRIWDHEEEKDDIDYYAKKKYVETSLKVARQFRDNERIAYFEERLSQYQAPRSERVKLLLDAYKRSSDKEKYGKALLDFAPQYAIYYKGLRKFMEPEWSPETLIKIARDFAKDRNYKNARFYYRLVINSSKASGDEKHLSWGNYCFSYKQERNREEFINCFGRRMKDLPNLDLEEGKVLTTKLKYARALWTENRTEQSIKYLKDLLKNYEGADLYIARAHVLLAAIYRERHQYTESTEQLKTALALSETMDLDERDDLVWELSFLYILQGQHQYAVNFLQNLDNPRAQFFLGRSLKKLGREKEAQEQFEKVFENDEFGYYGILASEYLKRPLSPIGHKNIDYEIPAQLKLLLNIQDQDKDEMINRFLRRYSYSLKEQDEILHNLPMYTAVGGYEFTIGLFFKIPKEERNALYGDYLEYVYPLGYKDVILKNAKRFGVPAPYIFSIIRQESGFIKDAKSFADAYGLMQVIPERARELARSAHVKYHHHDDLFKPEINVPIGTKLLRKNLDKYRFNYVAATAAYNAGDTPVKRWLKFRYDGDMVEFVENIPYQETRNYVKLVLRNYVNYSRLLSEKPINFTAEFLGSMKIAL